MAQSGKQDKARKVKTRKVWYRFMKAIDVNWDVVLKPLKFENEQTSYAKKSKATLRTFQLKKQQNIATVYTN